MKTFNYLSDLSEHNSVLAVVISAVIDDSDKSKEFMWSLGGEVHVIETQEEFDEMNKENNFFDIAEEVLDGWYQFVVINNNSGGPSWFVPSEFIEE